MKNQRNDSRLGLGFLGEWWLHMRLHTPEGKGAWEKTLLCNFMPRHCKTSQGILFLPCSHSCTCKVISGGKTFLPHPWHSATKPSSARDDSVPDLTPVRMDLTRGTVKWRIWEFQHVAWEQRDLQLHCLLFQAAPYILVRAILLQ